MISIAVPAFKARFFREALGSLLAQTWTDFEILVVDDASPEPIGSLVGEFNDPRISYHRNEVNLGGRCLVDNWNRCLELASRPWFVLASDDDIYEPTFLEKVMGLSQALPTVDVFHSRVSIIDAHGAVVDATSGCPAWESAADFLWHRLKRLRASYIPEFLFRTSTLRSMGGFVDMPAAWGSDVATCVEAGRANGIGCVSETLVRWRRSGVNISSSDRYLSAKSRGLDVFMDWADQFLSQSRDPMAALAKAALPTYFQATWADLHQRESFGSLASRLVKPGSGRAGRKAVLRALAMRMRSGS